MLLLRRMLTSTMVLALGIAGLLGSGGCSSSTPPMVGYHALPADLSSAGLRQLWQRPVTLIPGEKIVNVWRVHDSIYIATSQARVICMNVDAGTKSWEVNLVDAGYRIFRPAEVAGGKNVLILNRGGAFLVDKQTGKILMHKSLDVAVTTDPIVAAPNIFCAGSVNYFYAYYLDVLRGHPWLINAPNDIFTARPAVQEDSLLLASEAGLLWRVDLAKGDWVWKDRRVDGRVVGGLAADPRAVFIPCLDGNVYAFDMNSGGHLWTTPIEGGLERDLVATRGEVLVPTNADALYALSSARGEIRWHLAGVQDIGTMAGDRVWVLDTAGNLKALSLDSGEVLASAPVGGGYLVSNTTDRLVIVVSRSGVVGAYGPAAR